MSPIVVIPACTKLIGEDVFDAVGRKYSVALAEVAECQPLLVPIGAGATDIGAVLEVADAILLSGSPSNVAPEHYGEEAPIDPSALDPLRDAVTLPLVRAAVERKTPLFAICRGFQELNVALGGSLYQAVHAIDGHKDHRAPSDVPLHEAYGPVHPVVLRGRLRDWIGRDEIMVNSLHWQGISRLAKPLQADYLPAALTNKDYPTLVGPGESVETIAVGAVLVAYNWPRDSDRYQRIAKFVERFFPRLAEFQKPPRHPKWAEANLAATVPGWTRFPAAQEWLQRNNATAHAASQREQFERFLEMRPQASSKPISPSDREQLFQEFLKWSGTGERR